MGRGRWGWGEEMVGEIGRGEMGREGDVEGGNGLGYGGAGKLSWGRWGGGGDWWAGKMAGWLPPNPGTGMNQGSNLV